MSLKTRLLCWRGSRGFGVHSPFAFEFVLNVLRDRHPFYAYTDIAIAHHSADRRQRPPLWILKLVFRVSARLDYKDIETIGHLHPLIADTVTMPSSAMRLTVNTVIGPRLTVVSADTTMSPDDMAALIAARVSETGSLIVFGHIDAVRLCLSLLPHGMIFTDDTRLSVIVGHRHLPVKRYLTRMS